MIQSIISLRPEGGSLIHLRASAVHNPNKFSFLPLPVTRNWYLEGLHMWYVQADKGRILDQVSRTGPIIWTFRRTYGVIGTKIIAAVFLTRRVYVLSAPGWRTRHRLGCLPGVDGFIIFRSTPKGVVYSTAKNNILGIEITPFDSSHSKTQSEMD